MKKNNQNNKANRLNSNIAWGQRNGIFIRSVSISPFPRNLIHSPTLSLSFSVLIFDLYVFFRLQTYSNIMYRYTRLKTICYLILLIFAFCFYSTHMRRRFHRIYSTNLLHDSIRVLHVMCMGAQRGVSQDGISFVFAISQIRLEAIGMLVFLILYLKVNKHVEIRQFYQRTHTFSECLFDLLMNVSLSMRVI